MKSEMFNIITDKNYILSIVLIVFSLLGTLYFDYLHQTMWGDEPYTIALIQFSFSSIWDITSTDVHPPLYYMMLKAFTILFGDSVFSMRIFSNIAFLLILLCGLFPIRVFFGSSVSLIFIMIFTLLPISQFMAINIRMYSWVAFFILAGSLCAYKAFCDNKTIYYILLAILSACACYTHYYGGVASGCIYLILLFMLIVNKCNIKKLILSVGVLLILFSFWIPILLNQIIVVNNDYWIEPLNLKSFYQYANYFFSPKGLSYGTDITGEFVFRLFLVILIWIAIIILGFYAERLHRKYKSSQNNTALCFILVFILMVLSTIVYSILIKPIFVQRYMLCAIGPLILGISIYISNMYTKIKQARYFIFATLILLVTLCTLRFQSEKNDFRENSETLAMIKRMASDNTPKGEQVCVFSYSYIACIDLGILLPQYDYQLYLEDSTIVTRSKRPYNFNNAYDVPKLDNIMFIESLSDVEDIEINKYLIESIEKTHLLTEKKETAQYRVSYYKK